MKLLEFGKRQALRVWAKQGDTGRELELQCINNSQPINLTGCTVTLNMTKPGAVFINATILEATEGKISVGLTSDILSKKGIYKADISIFNAQGKVISSTNFEIDVDASQRDEGAVEATDNFSALQNAMGDIASVKSQLAEKANSTEVVKTVNGVAPDQIGNVVVQGGGGGEPNSYIKNASVSGNTLILTNKDNSTVQFTPEGGGGSLDNRLNVPEYLMANAQQKRDMILDYQNENTYTFAFLPDIHHDTQLAYNGNAIRVLNWLENEGVDIKKYIGAGDNIFTQSRTKAQAKANHIDLLNLMKHKEKFMACRGNHDDNNDNPSEKLSESELYTRMYKHIEDKVEFNSAEKIKGYYYYDEKHIKTRFIFLNVFDFPTNTDYLANSTHVIRKEQLNWLANKALNFSDKGEEKSLWNVIIVSHVCLLEAADILPSVPGRNLVINRNVVLGIVNAFRYGATYTSPASNASINNEDFRIENFSADFTSQGAMNALCYLFGHHHTDQAIYRDGVYHISSLPVHYFTDGITPDRTAGTLSEIAMDVITIDFSTSSIRATRFGAGEDRYFIVNDSVVDDFDRTDGSLLSISTSGHQWVSNNGKPWYVSNGKAYKHIEGGNTTYADAILTSNGKSDVTVSVDVTFKTQTSGGIEFRNSNASNAYDTIIDADGLKLRKRVNNSTTVISTHSFTPTDGTTYNLKVVLSGNSIEVYLDNVKVLTATDSFNATAIRHGLRAPSRTASAYMAFDNFSII